MRLHDADVVQSLPPEVTDADINPNPTIPDLVISEDVSESPLFVG
jgi:hypothetical protein